MTLHTRPPIAPMRLIAIGDVSRRLGVTARTLRFYQDQGLVRSHRLGSGVRSYDSETIARLEAIVVLRAAGLSVADIRAIITLSDQPAAQTDALRTALAETLHAHQTQITRLTALTEQMKTLDEGLPPPIAGLSARAAPPAS